MSFAKAACNGTLLFAICCLVCVESFYVLLVNRDPIPKDRSFELKSSISSSKLAGNSNTLLHLNEQYSYQQRRAKVQFFRDESISKRKDEGYLYDAVLKLGVQFAKEAQSCKALDLEALNSILFPHDSRWHEFARQISGELSHVVGPARLLFLIDAQAEKLVRIGEVASVQGLETSAYKLSYEAGEGMKPIEIKVYYKREKQPMNADDSSIPLRVDIYEKEEGRITSITYYSYKILDPIKKKLPSSSNLVLDQFAFPLSLKCPLDTGCQSESSPTWLKDLEHHSDLLVKFSFSNQEELNDRRNYHRHIVAIDGRNQLMRLEKIRQNQNAPTDPSAPDRTISISDFKANKRYLLFLYKNSSKISANPKGDNSNQCLTSLAYAPGFAQERFRMPAVLFGSSRLAYVGLGNLGGTRARIYETYAKSMPVWYNQPFVYRTNLAEGQQLFDERHYGERAARAGDSDQFNVIVYVAEDGAQSLVARILMVEFYNLKSDETASNKPKLVSQLFDIFYDPDRAHGAGRASKLFSSRALCSTNPARDDREELDLSGALLEDENGSDFVWIENSLRRNRALLVGLQEILRGQTGQIVNVDSRLTKSRERRGILATISLVGHSQPICEPIFVGKADLVNSNARRLASSARSPSECLWMIGGSSEFPKSGFVFYSDKKQSCLVDLDAGDDFNKLKLFRLDPKAEGDLFKIEMVNRGQPADLGTWMNGGKLKHFEGRTITLRNFENPSVGAQLKVRVNRIGSRGLSSDRQVSMVFLGFALPKSGPYTKLVNPIERKSLFGRDREPVMNPDLCEAFCLEDQTCLSYSSCALTETLFECVLSTADLHSVQVENQLTSREATILIPGSKIKISTDQLILNLVRDFACEIRVKLYSQLFNYYAPIKLKLAGLQVVPAKDVEQCASICFGKSIATIQASAQSNTKIRQLSEQSLGSQVEASRIFRDEMLRQYRSTMAQMCSKFMFLNPMKNSSSEMILDAAESEISAVWEGSCVFDESLGQNKAKIFETNAQEYELEVYKFDFTTLFERRFGLSLSSSSAASAKPSDFRESKGEHLDTQLSITDEPSHCAQQCFLQTSSLWPACLSFDLTFIPGKAEPICTLNSRSLGQVEREDEIFIAKSGQHMWHYEPRFGLARRGVDNLTNFDGESGKIDSAASSYLDLIFSFLELLSGISAGYILGAQLLRCFKRDEQTEALVPAQSINLIELTP